MAGYASQTEVANRQDFDNSFTAQYDNDTTNVSILSPSSSTKSLHIKGLYINTEGTSGIVRLTIDGNTIATCFANAQAGYMPVYITGAKNSPIKVTSTLGAAKKYFVLVNYKER